MSIFSKVESGTGYGKSRFSKSISNRMDYDCQFHQLIPVLKRFVLPGDVWKIGGDVLVRFQPMRTPTLTPNNFRVRYFFVPLRLVEPNAELIITGSQNGHLYSGTLPIFDNFVTKGNKVSAPNCYKVMKHSFWDYMNVQLGDYEPIKTDECLPANYWAKGYYRIIYDYYFDENLHPWHASFPDFESLIQSLEIYGADQDIQFSALSKDYFTSSLPWQLKGVAPSITLGVGSVDFTNCIETSSTGPGYNNPYLIGVNTSPADTLEAGTFGTNGITDNSASDDLLRALNKAQVSLTGSLDADDIRTMFAQTRIFERLARTGSRYTEYLRANFGIAPADDTLQRAQYLGGWKVPIVTTEVLQTAEGTDPVGTMRGHGITRGGNRIQTFFAKEFGMIFGIAEVRPDIQYTTGIPRQLSYKRRFDFFNPSFQHLSEQEVRNGELFISFTDGKNDDTFGFQAYANELRTCQNETVGDMRDTLGDWNQALGFTSRPNLNNAFINGQSHRGSFNRPFVVQSSDAYPIIVQFYNNLDVYRPMVRYATPGLVDHL